MSEVAVGSIWREKHGGMVDWRVLSVSDGVVEARIEGAMPVRIKEPEWLSAWEPSEQSPFYGALPEDAPTHGASDR